ncbi:uncharacterized protein LOC129950814 [Eupeodes corollae]|uniref:uncharacterized protein LOC129950814 n=1 Tax=Eupeodes corollae TaxID=290404 RepID=UPI00248FD3C8|nr:uncharacterized protein LOC129950814 [Eupeodes corollae]
MSSSQQEEAHQDNPAQELNDQPQQQHQQALNEQQQQTEVLNEQQQSNQKGFQNRHRDARCKICGQRYNDQMVLCDGVCKKWYHLDCVDISSSRAEELFKWFCDDCSVIHMRKIDALHQKIILQIKEVERNVMYKKRQTTIDSSYKKWLGMKNGYIKLIGVYEDSEGNPLPEPRLQLNEAREGSEAGRRSNSSINSRSSQRSLRFNLLQQQRDLLKEQRDNLRKDEELIKRQEELFNELSDEVSDEEVDGDCESGDQQRGRTVIASAVPAFKPSAVKVADSAFKPTASTFKPSAPAFIPQQPFTSMTPAFTSTIPAFTSMTPAFTSMTPAFTSMTPAFTSVTTAFASAVPSFTSANPALTSAFTPAPLSSTTYFNSPQLDSRQLAARKIYKELPTFTGSPEEWPLFKRMYEQSTQACGFSVEENLMRFQRALKGRARELVSSQLVEPSCVPQIMICLQMAFGQPNIILQNQIDNISRLPTVKAEKLESIVEFSTAVTNLNAVMKASNLEGQYDNPLLLKELLKKLTNDMKMRWATYSLESQTRGVLAFGTWLQLETQKVFEVLTSSDMTWPLFNSAIKRDTGRNDRTIKEARVNVHVQTKQTAECLVCGKKCKSIECCEEFKEMNSLARWEKVKELKLCRQCLTVHTMKYPFVCKKAVRCDVSGCKRRHHPLMHQVVDGIVNPPIVVTSQNSHTNECDCFQFQYIPVTLRHGNKKVTTMAFLDGGSSGTRIEDSVANQLGLTGPKVILHLKWTANVRRQEESKKVSMFISGAYNGAKEYAIPVAHTIQELNLPRQTLNYEELASKHPHLRGLPVTSYFGEQPRIMIGMSDWHLALPSKTRIAGQNDPVATKNKLGWSVFGSRSSSQSQSINYHIQEYAEKDDENLSEMMRYFFAVDSLGVKIPFYEATSKDERRAKDIMEKTAMFNGERFEIGLLWRYDDPVLPDSMPMAKLRQLALDRKLKKSPSLRNSMNQQMESYMKRGYVRKLSPKELNEEHKRIWYLPLFPVSNPNKPEKVRVVWDAAAKVNGVCLNSFLGKGPDQLPSLFGILLRFRQNAVAISGDIEEMFHQIEISPEDRHACRFLWDDGTGVAVYITQVMTFGASCSPSCAQFVKNKNAERFIEEHPRAVEAIINNHYVDDLLDSVNTSEEAITLAKDVKMIHSAGGFHIRKWKSNSREVTAAMNEITSTPDNRIDLDKEPMYSTEKVLGMWWDTESDSFTFSLKFNKGNQEVLKGAIKPTKREMLRIMMSIFDPLGLIGHFTSYLKVLMQDVWRSRVSWDDEILDEHQEDWLRWLRELQKVQSVFIPRCYAAGIVWEISETQLHVFVDASKNCSAAVAYLRVQSGERIMCSLFGSKTKVAPIKLMSIPRLELVAAVIGARFADSIRQSLSIHLNKIVLWSDSATVLSWLSSDAKSVKGQFVAFRIAEIQEITNIADWSYVPSEMNPADDATKWKKGPSLDMNDRWMQGPQFLYMKEEDWPYTSRENYHAISEVVSVIPTSKFESWGKLLRVTAYVCRYMDALRGIKRENLALSSEEFQRAERVVYRHIQAESLSSELEFASSPRNVARKTAQCSSIILSMKPYLDENGVMRSMSRIDNAKWLNIYTRRPVILPDNNRATRLLIRHYHEKFRHINHESVVNEVRKKYFIPKL